MTIFKAVVQHVRGLLHLTSGFIFVEWIYLKKIQEDLSKNVKNVKNHEMKSKVVKSSEMKSKVVKKGEK